MSKNKIINNKHSFLDEVAIKIINDIKVTNLKDITIILPSRRAGIYFKKILAQHINQSFLLPKITTINEFILDLSECKVIDSFEAELELYSCYKKIHEKPESLDLFLNLAPIIINDFNLIDKYLLKADKLLFDLKSIKEIENWSLNNSELTDNQNSFIDFWNKLGELYTSYHLRLKALNYTTEGHAYRIASDKIEKKAAFLNDSIYFIGLNALSSSEEKIINHLIKIKKAEILFDGDQYYTKNPDHEAGHFFRKFSFFKNQKVSNHFLLNKKEIKVFEAKTDMDQIHITSSIIQKENLDLDSTAIYLVDEKLLTPFVYNIPKNVNDLNITMGYSIINTYSFGFIKLILNSLDNKNEKEYWKGNKVNYKLILEILSLPIFNDVIKEGIERTSYWRNIIKYNIKFIDLKSFINEFPKTSEIISFYKFKSIKDPVSFLKEIIEYLILLKISINNKIEINAVDLSIESIRKMLHFIENYSEKKSIKKSVLIRSLIKQFSFIKIPFYGEPLKGLQVMGFLESRVLDYKNVILLSCNESYLPGSEFDNSLIPFDVKKHYKIPGTFEKDAIFSYYFYRSIQRSEKIFLIHSNNEKSKIGSSEPSRYLHQLEKEVDGNYKNILFKKEHLKFPNSSQSSFEISNDRTTISKVLDFFETGISPSAINCYLSCPKDFYFKYILKINEQPIIEDTIENNTWGTIIHNTLQNLYEDLGIITSKKIDHFLIIYQSILEIEFNKLFPDHRYKEGKNALLYYQASKCIATYLNNEKQNIIKNGEFEVIAVEKKLEYHINHEYSKKEIKIKLKGNIDRIDKTKNGIRIVDYKSGFIQKSDVKINGFNTFKRHKHALQLMTYALIYHSIYKEENIQPSIISLKNPKSNIIYLNFKNNTPIDSNVYNEFEKYLINFIEILLDEKLKFDHEKSSDYCMMC